MKILTFIALLLAAVIALPIVSAYGYYGGPSINVPPGHGFEGYGYGYIPPYQNFNMYDNTNRFNRDYTFDSAVTGNANVVNEQSQQGIFDSLFSNDYTSTANTFGSSTAAGSLGLADGYNLDYLRCSRSVRKINYFGDNLVARERVCGNIRGDLWRNNALSQSYTNDQGYGTFGSQTGTNQQNYNTQFNNLNSYTGNTQASQNQALSQQESRTTIARGAVIVLN